MIFNTQIKGGGSTAPAHYIEYPVSSGVLGLTTTLIDLTGVTTINDYVLYYLYATNTTITQYPDMSKIVQINDYGCANMFSNCTSIIAEKIDLSSLTTIGVYGCSNMFNANISGATVDLSSLTTVGSNGCQYMFAYSDVRSFNLSSLTSVTEQSACANMFNNCVYLTTADLSSLVSVTGRYGLRYMFDTCVALVSVDLSSLAELGQQSLQYMFNNCTALTTLSFPALTSSSFGGYTNCFNRMLNGCSNVTVHFPSNLQSVIDSWTDVTSGFGGTNITVLFDLPATE